MSSLELHLVFQTLFHTHLHCNIITAPQRTDRQFSSVEAVRSDIHSKTQLKQTGWLTWNPIHCFISKCFRTCFCSLDLVLYHFAPFILVVYSIWQSFRVGLVFFLLLFSAVEKTLLQCVNFNICSLHQYANGYFKVSLWGSSKHTWCASNTVPVTTSGHLESGLTSLHASNSFFLLSLPHPPQSFRLRLL